MLSLLTASVADAADDLFDFSDLDIVDSPGSENEKETAPPEDELQKALPESIRTVLGKLERFSAAKRKSLLKEIAAGRKVAAEILVAKATKTDAVTRAALLSEAKRVESLPPELPLVEAAGASSAPASALAMLMGTWKNSTSKWANTFAADGTFTHYNGKPGYWRWLDEKRGLIVWDYTPRMQYADLVQFDLKSNPPTARRLGDDGGLWILEKTASAGIPAGKQGKPSEPVTKLATHEAATRKELETLIKSKNAKVAAWLLQQAKSLPAPQVRVIVERASELEGKAGNSGTATGSPNFAGVWVWSGKKLEFAEGGIVKVNQKNAGKWIWAKAVPKSLIAFVLDTGDTAAFAKPSKSKEGVLYILPVNGKKSEARRE